MEFQKATETDIAAIAQIFIDGRNSLRSRGIDQWQGDYPAADDARHDIEAGCGYVVVNQGLIMGYAAVVFDGEEAYDNLRNGTWRTPEQYVVVHRMGVGAQYTHRGVAAYIMESVERLAAENGIYAFRIDTHPDNNYMKRLLTRQGFEPCGEVWYESLRIAYDKLIGR